MPLTRARSRMAQERADQRLRARLSAAHERGARARSAAAMRASTPSSPARCSPARGRRAPDPRSVVSPCDGTLSDRRGARRTEPAAGQGPRTISLEALLADRVAGPSGCAAACYATLYLAPYNYHRVHMPLDGRCAPPGTCRGGCSRSISATAARVPGLFARNERVVCVFEGEHGPFAVVLVGRAVRRQHEHRVARRDHAVARPAPPAADGLSRTPVCTYSRRPRRAAWQPRGAELGRFNMGSTVILLLAARQRRAGTRRCEPGAAGAGRAGARPSAVGLRPYE